MITRHKGIEDFNSLKKILEDDSQETLEMWEDKGRLFIDGIEAQLMVRLIHYTKSLVIAKIVVRNRRTGVGTQILNWLKEYAINNGFESITIESTTTPEINRFAEKHGFEPVEGNYFKMDGEIYGNYLLKL
jgi:GNAT superfamily N-acetyltransferase